MNEDLMKVIKSEEEIEQEVESLCRWAAARAGVIVVAPILGQIALAANEIYLIKRIANVYDKNSMKRLAVLLWEL